MALGHTGRRVWSLDTLAYRGGMEKRERSVEGEELECAACGRQWMILVEELSELEQKQQNIHYHSATHLLPTAAADSPPALSTL